MQGETASSWFAIRYIFDRRKTLFSLAQNHTHTHTHTHTQHNTHTHTHTHTRLRSTHRLDGIMTRFISFSTVLSHVKTMGDNVLLSAVAPDISASNGNRTASSVDWAARAPHHTPEKCYSLRMYVSDILNVPNRSFLIERDEKISVNSRVRSTSENVYIFNMRLSGKRVFFSVYGN